MTVHELPGYLKQRWPAIREQLLNVTYEPQPVRRKEITKFDRELERRGLRFARYADDSNIYVRSRRAGERVMGSLTRFLTAKLKLKVNQQKSAVARPWERKFLGFSFTSNREPKRRIAPKAVLPFKERVRELTRRTQGSA
jgi:RNA-directed DNA polymerase